MKVLLLLTAIALLVISTPQNFTQIVLVRDPAAPEQQLPLYELVNILKHPSTVRLMLWQNYHFIEVDTGLQEPVNAIQALLGSYSSKALLSSLIDEASKSRLESELASQSTLVSLSTFLESPDAKKRIRLTLEELAQNSYLISNRNTTTILTFNNPRQRLLADITVEPSGGSSNILAAISETSLSCILVSLFLAIALVIAVSCMMDLKTNDKFARNQLHIGKES